MDLRGLLARRLQLDPQCRTSADAGNRHAGIDALACVYVERDQRAAGAGEDGQLRRQAVAAGDLLDRPLAHAGGAQGLVALFRSQVGLHRRAAGVLHARTGNDAFAQQAFVARQLFARQPGLYRQVQVVALRFHQRLTEQRGDRRVPLNSLQGVDQHLLDNAAHGGADYGERVGWRDDRARQMLAANACRRRRPCRSAG